MKREFQMTPEDHAALLEACKPTPAMYLSGGEPMAGTPRENANTAWRRLGEKMGFDYMTVERIPGKPSTCFMAEPATSGASAPPEIDYTAMDGGALLTALRDDAHLWAEAFCQHAAKHSFDLNDRAIMVTWFANAIEHSHDVRRWRAEKAAKGDTQPVTPPLK